MKLPAQPTPEWCLRHYDDYNWDDLARALFRHEAWRKYNRLVQTAFKPHDLAVERCIRNDNPGDMVTANDALQKARAQAFAQAWASKANTQIDQIRLVIPAQPAQARKP